MFFISELLTILTFPPGSVMQVVRMPIWDTVPRKPPTSMISPTLYWLSSRMNMPVTMSAMRLSAPKPMMRAMIPSPARIAPMSTLSMASTPQRMTTAAA